MSRPAISFASLVYRQNCHQRQLKLSRETSQTVIPMDNNPGQVY
jgi:hypothetical protein